MSVPPSPTGMSTPGKGAEVGKAVDGETVVVCGTGAGTVAGCDVFSSN